MASFSDLISNSEVPVLVDFYADWCGPCKMMAPELEKLATATNGQLKVVKVNVDKNQSVSMKYQIKGIPALILFHKGNILWRTSGYQNAQQLQQQLTPYLTQTA